MDERRKHKRLDLDVSVQLERLDQDDITTLKFIHVVDAVLEIVRCDPKGDGTYKYGCVFVGMSDTDALKIDIYQIFNDV